MSSEYNVSISVIVIDSNLYKKNCSVSSTLTLVIKNFDLKLNSVL